jgi:transcriptional regulator with XRE-family HTH domain
MDQVKVGSFLKELRKEKNLTQENLAEQLNVPGRTISRWETGSNMPDALFCFLLCFRFLILSQLIILIRCRDSDTKQDTIPISPISLNIKPCFSQQYKRIREQKMRKFIS